MTHGIGINYRRVHVLTSYFVGIKHYSNGFEDLLSNEVTTPELTIADNGRLLDISVSNEASTDARLDVYISNSLGHHIPGRIFSSFLPTLEGETQQVIRSCGIQKFESIAKI